MFIRRELPADADEIDTVHRAAFLEGRQEGEPAEVELVRALRASPAWIPQLAHVALSSGHVVGHATCVRCTVGEDGQPALGLIPLGVRPDFQARGFGSALMYSVLGAADAMDEPLVCLVGSTDYYRRFGFEPAAEHQIRAPVAAWTDHFQVRTLTAFHPGLTGLFRYPEPVMRL